jgi:hypothetical protein
MKKKIFLLGVAGVAGGLLYALESSWRKQNNGVTTDRDESANTAASSANGRESSTLSNTNPAGSGADRVASMARIEDGRPSIESEGEHPIDDHGTGQSEAADILRFVRDNAFEASDEKLALALGRPTEEIEQWTSGSGSIDGDVVIKARALAMQRGVEGDLA